MNKSDSELEKQAFIDLQEQKNGNVLLDLSLPEAWSVFGMLQLALRHPELPANSKRVTTYIARRLQSLIATTPALEELARRGWDQNYDEHV